MYTCTYLSVGIYSPLANSRCSSCIRYMLLFCQMSTSPNIFWVSATLLTPLSPPIPPVILIKKARKMHSFILFITFWKINSLMTNEKKFHSRQIFEVQKLLTLHFFILYPVWQCDALHDIIYFIPLPCPLQDWGGKSWLETEAEHNARPPNPTHSNLTIFLALL